MQITRVVPQLRTTNLVESIRFYTTMLGGTLEFEHEDFYAGIRFGSQVVHLKLVDDPDPSIAFVRNGEHFDLYLEADDLVAAAEALQRKGVRLVRGLHETAWGTREFVIEDDQGHTLYFGARG
jgi:catechol 2,3-dioxygenase-like lactoylglutathione lyase family enzyme